MKSLWHILLTSQGSRKQARDNAELSCDRQSTTEKSKVLCIVLIDETHNRTSVGECHLNLSYCQNGLDPFKICIHTATASELNCKNKEEDCKNSTRHTCAFVGSRHAAPDKKIYELQKDIAIQANTRQEISTGRLRRRLMQQMHVCQKMIWSDAAAALSDWSMSQRTHLGNAVIPGVHDKIIMAWQQGWKILP